MMQRNNSGLLHLNLVQPKGVDVALLGLSLAVRCLLLVVLSYMFGWLAGNRRCGRDTAIIIFALVIYSWRMVYTVISNRVTLTGTTQMVCALTFQVIIAFFKHKIFPPSLVEEAQPNSRLLIQPTLLPCRTSHVRLFPKRHGFSYSYFFVGIPIKGWSGSIKSVLSINSGSKSETWFSVHGVDYLARGSHPKGLEGKLEDYLKTQGAEPTEFVFSYLVTAPRFLGFSFNPVSFWYLYNKQHDLAAMILEVNNTFDERRMYFMRRNLNIDTSSTQFRAEWQKDFHVSPFNSRDSSDIYSLEAINPVSIPRSIRIDNNIVLKTDDKRAKIVARVFSTEAAIDPASLNSLHLMLLLAKWWWVGLATNLRILREARVLWTKGLKVFYRPEVKPTSIGRNPDLIEIELESIFRNFLQAIVDHSNMMVKILYTPAAGENIGRAICIVRNKTQSYEPPSRQVHLVVLTPAFYGEFARSCTAQDAVSKCCVMEKNSENMLHTDDRVLLQALVNDYCQQSNTSQLVNLKERLIMSIKIRRCLHNQFTKINQSAGTPRSEIAESLDKQIKSISTDEDYNSYLNCILWLTVADKLAFGLLPLLRLYIIGARLACLAGVVGFTASTDAYLNHNLAAVLLYMLYLSAFHGLGGVISSPSR